MRERRDEIMKDENEQLSSAEEQRISEETGTNHEERQQRKAYAAKGEKSQKMCSYRIDLENVAFLKTVRNAGRLINDLIAAERARRRSAEIDELARRANRLLPDERETTREDYLT